MPLSLPFTEDEEANRLLASDPLALLLGMLLDQQFPMERAFHSPLLLQRRLGALDAAAVAALPEEDLVAAFAGPPALHRYPASMARRFADLCAHLVAHHEGDAAALWSKATDGEDLYRRLRALPGFGEAKARIFIAVVGRRLAAGPPGWERRAADWPSIADVDDFSKVAVLREQKRALKAGK